MRADGWCPYMITLLHQRYNSTALNFATNFERIGLAQNIFHTSLTPAGNAEEAISVSSPDLCSEAQCAKLQLKEDQYRPRHTGSCDEVSCYEVVADPDEIHTILTDPGDSYPLICPRLNLDDSSRRIDLTTYRPGLEYIAISHVWSDGLGNVRRNAIPSCQLYRLSRLTHTISANDLGTTYFWLDTICVPPDQAQDDEAQQAALSRMRTSYEAARIVLVLDSWLQTQRMQKFSDGEVLLKILTSLWNTRLWTLQEGALAKRLFFEFSDGLYDADAGLQRLHDETDLLISFLLKPVIFQRFEDFWGFRKHHRSIDRIVALSHGLQSRSTSVTSDEPLCLGTMLGLDAQKISKASPEMRMRVFWSLVETIPASLLFYNGPRLEEEGFRWAPCSFLRRSFNGRTIINPLPSYTKESIAVRTNRGLLTKFPGFVLTIPTTLSVGQLFWLLDDQRRLYSVTTHMETVKGATEYQESAEDVSSLSGCYKINPWTFTSDDKSTWPILKTAAEGIGRDSFEYGNLALITMSEHSEINGGWRSGILGVVREPPKIGCLIAVRRVCEVTMTRVNDEKSLEAFERILTESLYQWYITVPFGTPHPKTRCLRMACGFVPSKEQLWRVD